jgi:hypothetical protein
MFLLELRAYFYRKRKREEGRGKKEEGRRKREEGKFLMWY